ncbi:MAG: galactose oxidase, partial [Planctomycetota bacterium]
MKWQALIMMTVIAAVGTDSNAEVLQWSELPDIPETLGVAGAFSGISSDALIVAGGANFPEPLFKDGQVNPLAKKIWWGRIY